MFLRILLLGAVANCSLLQSFSNRPAERRLLDRRILGRRKRIYFNQDRERVRVPRQDDSYGSPAAPPAASPTSCPASCTCSCPATPSTSLLYTPRPSFEPTAPTGPPPSSYHVSFTEEQSNGQPYQPGGQQGYQQQPSNSVASNPTQDAGTLFYQRPEEEEEESLETTAAPEVTPYVQTYPSYSKPFTSFSTSSPSPPPAPSGYPSTSPPSFPPQVEEAFPHLFGGSADSPWESHRYTSSSSNGAEAEVVNDGDSEAADDLDTNLVTAGSVDRPPRRLDAKFLIPCSRSAIFNFEFAFENC